MVFKMFSFFIVLCWYIKTIDFCILTLVSSVVLLNWLINSTGLIVDASAFFMCTIVSYENKGSSISSLPMEMPFPLCLFAVACISSRLLNTSRKGRHSYIVPNFRGEAFSLFKCVVNFFIYTLYEVEEVPFYS